MKDVSNFGVEDESEVVLVAVEMKGLDVDGEIGMKAVHSDRVEEAMMEARNFMIRCLVL